MLNETLANFARLMDTEFCRANRHLFELIISDNNSSDETQFMSADREGNFKLFRQESNLGFLGNIDFLAAQATGDFLWFVGCGETISNPDFLEDILPVLDSERVLNLVLGSSWSYLKSSNRTKFTLAMDDDRRAKFFSESISGNVFNTSAYKDSMAAPLRHGSWWPHVERILHMMEAEGNASLKTYTSTDAPLVIGASEKGWAHEAKSYLAPARELDLLYSLPVKRLALSLKRRKLGYLGLPTWICSQKAVNNFTCTVGDLAEISKILGNAPVGVRLVTLLALLFPAPPLRLARAAFLLIRAPKI